MSSQIKLFAIGNFNFKLNHLLILFILSLSFTISFLFRSINGYFGWELHEFDPFFNYRATQFLLDNGLNSYLSWNDNFSWYPNGRDISQTSQVFLHLFAGSTYSIFNFGLSLYDYLILFPVVIGSSTSIIIFALVRSFSSTSAGLIASLLFSISLPVIIRGSLGWFKSEPLGLFFGLFATYMFLSGLKNNQKKFIILKLIISALFIIFSISSWGGSQFLIITISLFMISLPFFYKDKKSLLWKLPIFTISCFIFGFIFERTTSSFVSNYTGLLLLFSISIPIVNILIGLKFKKHFNRNAILITVIPILSIIILLVILPQLNLFDDIQYRYLNAINPLLTSSDPLIDSIAEHTTNNTRLSFFFNSILLIFSGLGVWLIFSKKFKNINPQFISFPLIIGIFGVYISSSFMRLELFSSIGLIILSSISISLLIKNTNQLELKRFYKYSIYVFIIILLIFPLIPINGNNSFSAMLVPSTILNGGTQYSISTSDWIDTLQWINKNTEKDAVVASWWDYGYWIQTIGNRATISDNSTLIGSVIQKTAEILFMNENDAWIELQDKGVDYFIIFVSGERLVNDNQNGEPLYMLGGGGDESKKYWFAKIANVEVEKYIHADRISGTDEFWSNTILGKMIPFEILGYVNLETQQQSLIYQPGYIGVYRAVEKFNENDPFTLVYASPSYYGEAGKPMIGIFVYQVNSDFIPRN